MSTLTPTSGMPAVPTAAITIRTNPLTGDGFTEIDGNKLGDPNIAELFRRLAHEEPKPYLADYQFSAVGRRFETCADGRRLTTTFRHPDPGPPPACTHYYLLEECVDAEEGGTHTDDCAMCAAEAAACPGCADERERHAAALEEAAAIRGMHAAQLPASRRAVWVSDWAIAATPDGLSAAAAAFPKYRPTLVLQEDMESISASGEWIVARIFRADGTLDRDACASIGLAVFDPAEPTVDTTATEADSALEEAVAREAQRIRVQELARARVRAETAERIDMPTALTLTALLASDIADEPQLIDGLWPAGGNVLCAAQRKAGKTTTVHNLARSLVDAEPFLDHFAVSGSRRVALLDFELAPSLLRGWLRDQGIRNPAALLVVPMRGRGSSFDIRDDRTRTRWATLLRDHGAEVLILDPLRPIIDSLGIDEWNGVGPLLQAFDALKEEAGVQEGLIIQHHGHSAERAAGDSRLVGWPDGVWDLTRDDPNDPRSFRYFSAYGRDVDVDKGLVSMYDGHRLAFAPDAADAKRDRLAEELAAFVTANPGAKSSDIEAAGIRGVSKNTVAAILKRAEAAGLVRVEAGARGAKLAFPIE